MLKPGIYTDMSNDEYHGDKETFSRSALMDFKRSPYFYWANHVNPARPQKEKTPAMIFGSAFHEFMLEPKEFEKHYACEPPKVLLKNVGREKYDEFKAYCAELEESGKIILKDEEFLTLTKMKEALLAHPEASQLFLGGVYESAYIWQDKESGLICKTKPDILHANMIVDLKTCADASPAAFQRAMASGGYHIQGAMARDGIKENEGRVINNVLNICIETKYPFAIGIYLIDEAAIEVGEAEFKETLLALNHAIVNNEWPSYQVETIGLPRWYQ